jgi:hypothetical protein
MPALLGARPHTNPCTALSMRDFLAVPGPFPSAPAPFHPEGLARVWKTLGVPLAG